MKKFTVVGLGEVLWDVFLTHKQMGGAPANFAYISSLLGNESIVASRVEKDALGDEVVERLQRLGLDGSFVQRDASRATGTVKVALANGQPKFGITQEVAWDYLEWTPELRELASKVDAVCFGTLAQRAPLTRETIRRFLSATRSDAVRVFDVNLRQSYYSAEVLAQSAGIADILKLNDEEMPVVMRALGAPEMDELSSARWLCERFHLKLVSVTRGGRGSLLVSPHALHDHPGYPVNVEDTVGAGDAFTATLLHHYLRGSDLQTMSDAANRMGAWVASEPGATPAPDAAQLEKARIRVE